MNKHLWKSTLKSFFKNKVGILLLSIIVFMTSGMFTLLETTSHSFQTSYNNVISQGKLHDFTVKEKYSYSGDVTYDAAPTPMSKKTNINADPKITKISIDLTIHNITGDFKSIYEKYPKKFGKITVENVPKWGSLPGDKSKQANYLSRPLIISKIKELKENFQNLMTTNKQKEFADEVTKKYGYALYNPKKVESLSVNSKGRNYKIVNNGNSDSDTDKLLLFKGNNVQHIIKKSFMQDELDKKIKQAKQRIKAQGYTASFSIDKSKDWKWSIYPVKTWLWNKIPCPTEFVYDKSSFEAVVSPGYAKKNNIKPIEPSVLTSQEYLDATGDVDGNKSKEFINKYKENIIMIDGSFFVVTGIGITPDFSYPIIDNKHPVVDVKNQAILFVNGNGYDRMKSSFKTNPQENYLAYKFKDEFKGDKNEVMKGIEYISTGGTTPLMSWPKNIHALSKYNDIAEKVIMAPHRITFLEKINKTLRTVALILVNSLLLLSSIIIVLIVKRNISSQKKTLAVLNANGYSKFSIASSFILIGLIVVGISTVLGYIAGYSLQFAFIKVFDNYWTLPIFKQSFSWISLLITVILPVILVSILMFVISLWELRGNVLKKLSGSESQFGQLISSKVVGSLKWFGIKTKLSASLLFTNISKMVLILVATTGTIVATTTAITTFGKFDKAISETNLVNKYKYATDFVSPTNEGGQYHATIYQDPKKLKNTFKNKPKRYWSGLEGNEKYGHIFSSILNSKSKSFIHSPSKSDADVMKSDSWENADAKTLNESATYLKNRVQFKFLLNVWMGALGMGSVPWDVAKGVMPNNQISLANKDNIEYVQKLLNFYKKQIKLKNINIELISGIEDIFDNYIKNKEGSEVALQKKLTSGIFTNLAIVTEIQNLVQEAWKAGIRPYQLSYNNVSMNVDDETYTTIKGETTLKNMKGSSSDLNLSIKGLNPDTKYINLGACKEKLNDYHWKKGDPIPVIVNQYMKQYYNLKVGSEFNMNVHNSANRFKLKAEDRDLPIKKFKVIDIVNSYSNNQIFTRHDIANQVLGLDIIPDDEGKITKNIYCGFNGVFSGYEAPESLKNMNLYSPSGLYPAWDHFDIDKQSDSYKIMNALCKNPNSMFNYSRRDFWNKFKLKDGSVNMKKIIETYSITPYMAMISDVDWARMSKFTFDSINNLSSYLIWMAEGLALIMAIIFIIIIGTMMVNANKRNISTLKVLGYRNKEIKNAFIKSMIPSLIIGLIIAIPIIFGLLFVMKISIMSFGSVLIPLNMMGWEILTSGIIVIGIYILIFIFSIRSLNGQSSLEAFKE